MRVFSQFTRRRTIIGRSLAGADNTLDRSAGGMRALNPFLTGPDSPAAALATLGTKHRSIQVFGASNSAQIVANISSAASGRNASHLATMRLLRRQSSTG